MEYCDFSGEFEDHLVAETNTEIGTALRSGVCSKDVSVNNANCASSSCNNTGESVAKTEKKNTPQETARNFKITGRFLRFF